MSIIELSKEELFLAMTGQEYQQSEANDSISDSSTHESPTSSFQEIAPILQEIGRIKDDLDKIHLDRVSYKELRGIIALVHQRTRGEDEGRAFVDWYLPKPTGTLELGEIEQAWTSIGKNEAKAPSINLQSLIEKYPKKTAEAPPIILASASDQPKTEDGTIAQIPPARNVLDRYTLNDQLEEIERQAVAQVPVLGQFALLGQSTVIYACPNAGKTLITIAEIINTIKAGKINPADLYYINNDDTTNGLVEKLRIANEYDFKMIAETFQDFQASDLQRIVRELIEKGHARGKVLILDTTTKFVNVLKADEAREFTKMIRKLVLQGGTVIALAHANKNPGPDGKPVYRGTTDLINDSDCVYVMSQVQATNNEKVVLLENRKRRGNVPDSVAYSYSTEPGISYTELVSSVKAVDQDQLDAFQKAEVLKSDAEVIAAAVSAIQAGTNTKMLLADAVAERAGISKRQAIKVIERYTGNDPTLHRWTFVVKERGAKVFELLDTAPAPTNDTIG